MSDIDGAIAQHYGDAGLLGRILAGLEAAGADLDNLRPENLAPVDEFHIGGRKATEHAIAKLSLKSGQRVLDVGCGIGGTTRYIAADIGCRVSGIDLTPEYIDVARDLADRTGLGGEVSYEVASALDMPFEPEIFDAAVTFHVAMNIHDRAALYAEVARVLKPGAAFCVYDVMKKNDEDLSFPVPWAQVPETSHVITPDETCNFLKGAGFEVDDVEDRTDFALEFFRQGMLASADGPPPLGLHLLMGPTGREKFQNALLNIELGRMAPVEIIARRRTG